MKHFRLTVHLANQPKVDTRAPRVTTKKGPQKSAVDMAREEAKRNKSSNGSNSQESSKGRYKVFNTISSYHKSKEDCMKQLSDIKTKYEIAVGMDHNKPSTYGKELYNISFVN